MEVKIGDFVKVNYDMYANGILVQTTNEKKGKENNLKSESFKPAIMIVGKAFLLKALDDAMEKNVSGKISLKAEEAFGKKDKKLIRTFPAKTFEEHKMRPVVGITYDFNGMYGTVKAVTGGRVMVDFNNPLAGRDIKIDYNVENVIDDISEKISFVLETVLKIPSNLFKVKVNDLKVILEVPKQLISQKEQIKQTLNEFIFEFHEYNLDLIEKKEKSKSNLNNKKN